MIRMSRFAIAALASIMIGAAAIPAATAAPTLTGTGTAVIEGTPNVTEDVRWRGGRGFGRGFRAARFHRPFYRPARFHRPYYRPFRPVYARPFYVRPAYYGPRCFWRPARTVWTPYGWRWRPAARICRW
jgi:hypothetical protein